MQRKPASKEKQIILGTAHPIKHLSRRLSQTMLSRHV